LIYPQVCLDPVQLLVHLSKHGLYCTTVAGSKAEK
jgi:hypothetical protein